MNNIIEIIEMVKRMFADGFPTYGMTVEEMANAFSESQLRVMYDNFLQYKKG